MATTAGLRVASRVLASGNTLHSPELVFVEVTSAFRRMVSAGTLAQARAEDAIRDLAALRLKAYPHLSLVGRVWELRHNLSAYDATYVALAETLDAPLLTCDGKMSAAQGHHARIEAFEPR